MSSVPHPLVPALAALAAACASAPPVEQPLFEFALIADVQYADKDTAGDREYRRALEQLDACVADLRGRPLAFVAQLGDVIDGRGDLAGSREDLERVLSRLEGLGVPLVHVIGNHGLAVPRDELQARLGLERSWYTVARDGWRFVVLDSMALSVQGVPPDDPRAVEASAWLAAHPSDAFPEAQEWNGGFGAEQLAWLADTLAAAEEAGERVVVMAHHPVLVEATRPHYLAWDHDALLACLERSPAVVAYLAGHDHSGGYARDGRVHHLTLPAMLAAPPGGNAYARVEAWPDRLVLHGVGLVAERVLTAD